jgi:DNA-binding GntR family transcriptional regulator
MRATPVSRSTVELLRTHVLDGTLLPGTRLIELQLAEHYSVSRATVRIAIGELVKEGLVDHEPNRGAIVRRVDLAEAIRITEVRCLLEGFMAARAAIQATTGQRNELVALIREMRESVEARQLARYGELNTALHRRIREISRHDIAAELVQNLGNRAVHHQFRLALVPGRAAESLPQHVAIVEAIVEGDASRAQEAMRVHLDSVIAVLTHWAELGLPGNR